MPLILFHSLNHIPKLPSISIQSPTNPIYYCPSITTPSPFRHRSIRVEARHNTRKENPKVRNLRFQKKFNGSPTKPRLSVFCSNKQLYAMLVDDQNKRTLFYATTLQKSIRGETGCTTAEAAQKVGEELIKACKELNISEISSYDRNGLARGERMIAFEIPISQHGFLLR